MRASAVILLALAAQGVADLNATPAPAASDLPAPVEPGSAEVNKLHTATFNVIGAIWKSVDNELDHSRLPEVVALLALAFGLVLLFKGKLVFDWAVMGFLAVIVGILAKQAAMASWKDEQVAISRTQAANVVGLIAAAFTVFVSHIGFRGILVLLGAAVGFCVAEYVQTFLVVNLSASFLKKIEVEVLWYSVVCLFCAFMVYKEKHSDIFAFLCPFPGGIFAASGVLFFATELFARFACTSYNDAKAIGEVCPLGLTPKTGQWIEFFNVGFANFQGLDTSKDVGIFYGRTISMDKDPKQSTVSGVGQDHLLTLFLWVVFTIIGLYVQREQVKRRRSSSVSSSAGKSPKPAKKGKMEQGARQPLL